MSTTPSTTPTSAAPGSARIAADLTAAVPDIPADLALGVRFSDVDIDSLVLAETAVVATRLYGVAVEDWELRDAGTLGAAAELIQQRIESSGTHG